VASGIGLHAAPSGEPQVEAAESLIARLNERIETALRPLIPAGHPVALIGFPSHANVGDSAIWLGETTYLRRHRNRIVYVCDPWSYSRAEAERRVGEAIVLLTGGGNFGDLYPENQRLRERVIADFPERRIVQLPQTIWFTARAGVAPARAIVEAHPDFTLVVRDARSLEFAERQFDVPTALCPDMAFALGPLPRRRRPAKEMVWLARSDAESAGAAAPTGPELEMVDWLRDDWESRLPVANTVLRRATPRIRAAARRPPRAVSASRPLLVSLYKLHARARLAYGCGILSGGRTVVTDRLHGHILSTLLGIPHALLDNSYGKVGTFHATWTRDLDLVRWARDPAEALRLASELATASGAPGTARERTGNPV
jgi:exopolysaccharide biosynthesis predicted pyruvyltransferase EpsI